MSVEPQVILARAVAILQTGSVADLSELDHAPSPLYATDADGVITYYNKACIDFAGRAAEVGRDRWCVTWRLFSDTGQALPHDECPMAVALRERREIRGVTAVAERPDGGRRRFTPYPTPVLDQEGALLGAVNLFMEPKDAPTAVDLRARARKWRRVALSVDPQTAAALEAISGELESEASRRDAEDLG